MLEFKIVDVIFMIPALLFAVIIHEIGHGLIAYKLGDDTAKREGRLTLNPVPHIDPLGSLLLPGLLIAVGSPFLFGWAKPVPINPYNFKKLNIKTGVALTSFAGPFTNILFAVIFALLYRLSTDVEILSSIASFLGVWVVESIFVPLAIFFKYSVTINLILAIFNLLPIPPLDGGHILLSLLPSHIYQKIAPYEQYGFFILILLLFTGVIGYIIMPIYVFLIKILL
ncbi:MAG: site-2 protease family protein [Hydrogenothermaceae bacterium]|nr:site-2 protease family protein [Hydrogenothermaceae bacterium]